MVTTEERKVGQGAHEEVLHAEHHHHAADLGHEVLHEVDVVADDVSAAVLGAWFALVTVLSVVAPIAEAGNGLSGVFVALWALGVVTALAGAVPFWRGHRQVIAAGGVAVALLVPLLVLVS